ncbi:aminotransferase class I/II-fold pyridoxal phosphate-dependent enzyme [bacterium]|nr:aminotransferase class I/II-fold pyridoxal phosphate-dependent enzyme [bacterium]MDC1221624.1 aminotransferase class I/II-fold pyridoxal phosphate-dependent enzyme [Salibacteraceae bacterium]
MKTSSSITYRKYYNISEYRSGIWNRLKEDASVLREDSNEEHEILKSIHHSLEELRDIEKYWAFPGVSRLQWLEETLSRKEYFSFSNSIDELVRLLVSRAYYYMTPESFNSAEDLISDLPQESERKGHYFEVLFVNDVDIEEQTELRNQLKSLHSHEDEFYYDVVHVRTFQDALLALNFNHNIQSCVIKYNFPFQAEGNIKNLRPFVSSWLTETSGARRSSEIGNYLGKKIKELRPELDLFLVTDLSVEKLPDEALHNFRNIFYRQEDLTDLHLNILKGIDERFETPFYNALVSYSKRPTGVFHAMPISRGNSIFKSNWIKEMGDFYGRNIFLAETSATTGGLDSLLQPTGPLKKAQELASRAFGSRQSFFVTNGTSTANKIVVQALVQPGDVILIDRDCHKSHHYGLVLSGAKPVYLDSYHLEQYSMYGGIPLKLIKEKLLSYKKAGRLAEVKMLLLTNCTFDGIVYNVQKFMEEILAIKPDMIFLWDEAWFGYARFSALFRKRTAMASAEKLHVKYCSEDYRVNYQNLIDAGKSVTGMPDPDKVKIRVYSTQSTHKTLTSLRQGSMIHIYDEQFAQKAEESFIEAYMTHTSTSPSYQILASLDMGRRQAELEGNELVERSVERAMMLRVKIANTPLLKKYFDILTVTNLIPEQYRKSGFERYYSPDKGWGNISQEWRRDEFVLDPTKINLFIGRTGIDGDTFKKKYLMDQFGIQVNKTSRNTVLFMTNIGTTRSSVAKLIGVLIKIAQQLDERVASFSKQEAVLHDESVSNLTVRLPSLPNFSFFHSRFRSEETDEGNIRDAYFMAYNEEMCENLPIEKCESLMGKGREIVSASFVIPYPPGFPILVPGQVMTKGILEFMQALDVTEIHSYNADLGLRVFTESALIQNN